MRKLILRPQFILIIILLICLFFRTYDVVGRFEFAHDGDLYSWIVKDIIVNHHYRLIGQLTSAPGIFIGPLFYYSLVPFFMVFNMSPIGALVLATIIGLITTFSFYWVFSKLFNKEIGLIASFLDAALLYFVNFDRWVVPTVYTNLWTIWYFYAVIMLARGNFAILPLLGILVGLIWQVHIALIPALIAVPTAIIISRKLPNLKQSITFVVTLAITSLPLILFESRHGFSQTQALIHNLTINQPGPTGLFKLQLIFQMISRNVNDMLFAPQSIPLVGNSIMIIILLISALWLVKRKLLTFKELIPLYAWFLGVVLFFTLSSSLISEYYFFNINIIFITIITLFLYALFRSSKLGKILLLIILTLLLIKNVYFFTSQYVYHKGYIERKGIADFIALDAKTKGYSCVGISYITAPGENVGFRYFFYLNNLHLVHPSINVPVYNIVLPDELALGQIDKKLGHIGVIIPKEKVNPQAIQKSCETPNTNLTDPVFGYVD
ncbi:MAG: glycosyltransferase family 39 protein [Candidatus Daviesbacteria bacterium]|nr:glycosyltransferase family 39 protein [Candidatus Daviesbacteria bacterium]